MRFTLDQINKFIVDALDAIYLTDAEANKYYAIKTDEKMQCYFGTEGSYREMMKKFMSGSMGKAISEDSAYAAFYNDACGFQGKISKKARMRVNGEEINFQMTHIPIDNVSGLILIAYVDEDAYLSETRADDKINAVKSAYLFSMLVDLKNDMCSNIDMSEVDDNPANSLSLTYKKWRETIINMFLDEDKEKFLAFTDPQYIMDNLNYNSSKVKNIKMMNLEGKFIWVNLIFSRVNTGNDDDFKVVFVVENVNETHEALERNMNAYKNKSMKDSLTGLFNHGRIEELLDELLKKSRTENKPLSLIMMDIDHFKSVNDTYGHAVGDAVLKTFSAACEEYLNPEKCKLGRWGGEEFIGICLGAAEEEMEKTAEGLRAMIEKRGFDLVGHITSSFGVIEVRPDETTDQAFERVDRALYAAKQAGRNKVVKG